jgi:hypothetical protein
MSASLPGAQPEPVHPRERRDAGHRRARQVTGWSAAGGTALAVVFGVVFAGSTPPAAAGAPDADATASGSEGGTGAVVPTPVPVLDAPAPVIDVPAPTVAPPTTHHRKLSPPVQAPQVAAPSPQRRHASSGAS